MNPDDLLTRVTAIVKYDLFPYYLVFRGLVLENGNVQVEGSSSFYHATSVIKTLPRSVYEVTEEQRRRLRAEHLNEEICLRQNLLAGNPFVGVNKTGKKHYHAD